MDSGRPKEALLDEVQIPRAKGQFLRGRDIAAGMPGDSLL